MRSLVVLGCAVAGVWLLSSPGWALVCGSVLVLVLWRGDRVDVRSYARRAGDWLRTTSARVRSAPRRSAAVGTAIVSLCLAPIGFMMELSAGLALMATAGALVAAALLLGWNT